MVFRPSFRVSFGKTLPQAHGTESKPITIKAASGADQDDVVLRGDGNSRMFEIRHDYYIIKVNIKLTHHQDNFISLFRQA